MKGKRTGRVLLLALAIASLGLASCEEGGASSSSPSPAESADEILWAFEEETYVPDLDPNENRMGLLGGTERTSVTDLVFYQGYDEVNDDEPYVYRDLGNPASPYETVEARLSPHSDYLAYYLPAARVTSLEKNLASFYENERHSIFGAEEDGLYDGRYIYMNSLEGQDGLLKMMVFEDLDEVPLGDEEYSLVGLFERREMAYELDLTSSESLDKHHYVVSRLILDGKGEPLYSLSGLYPSDIEDLELAAAVRAYAAERRVFERYEGLVLSFRHFVEGRSGGYLQAPALSPSDPFRYEGRFLPLEEIEGATLLRERRYQDEVDLLEQGLAADAFPLDIDPFGDGLRSAFKEAWLFDVEGSSYAYFDWGKLRLSLGEARRAHLSEIQSAGSL